ncbi:MAG: tetratricopeptide repeat protein [Clostridia bacterium]|nr:tetratricopeptide repeat protein [Clostridia bacterium]
MTGLDDRLPELSAPEAATRIPIARIRDRLDALTGKKDYPAAARLLAYWRDEARIMKDVRGEFFVLNEMMGVFRKSNDREKALESAEGVLRLVSHPEISGSIGAGTAYVNAGTVYKYSGDPMNALECFRKARTVYEQSLEQNDERLGGLYNNMALALMDLGHLQDAISLFESALRIMRKQPFGGREEAITLLNMADVYAQEKGPEAAEGVINDCLRAAERLLLDPSLPRDEYHAFVCEKCAPVFSYYGWFKTASELESTAALIRRNDNSLG